MPYTLTDGREVTINLEAVSVREWRAMFDPRQPQADEDATICKITGLALDELTALSVMDYKRLYKAIVEQAREPLPN